MISSDLIYQSLIENLADGLLVSGADGTVQVCNKSFASLIGWAAVDIIGKSIDEFIKLDHSFNDTTGGADGESHLHDEIVNSGSIANELGCSNNLKAPLASIISKSGLILQMPAMQQTLFDKDNKVIAFLTVVYIVQAHSVQQAQTEFVSTVSHELRTPLTSIKGFADTMLRAGDKLDKSQQRRYIGIIKDQADRLTRLVEDLLAVSRLESKKLQLTIRAIDLHEAIERVLRNLADKAGNHRIISDIPNSLPPIWADADRLEQILTNLIDNAIKYSVEGTTVAISARELSADPELIEFTVTDQGVGIPEEHLPKIFTKFGRLDNPLVRQTEGTGLGLYITRSLVLALGGKIEVTSKPGQTTFTVRLPVASLEKQAARGRG